MRSDLGIRRPVNGSPDSGKQRELMLAARRTQRVPIAVAPGTHLAVIRAGKSLMLAPGETVLATDFVGNTTNTVQSVLLVLVDEDAVIALGDEELARLQTPASARFVVAKGCAVSTAKRGIISEGCELRPEDFARGQLDITELVARGAVVDRQQDTQPDPPADAKRRAA